MGYSASGTARSPETPSTHTQTYMSQCEPRTAMEEDLLELMEAFENLGVKVHGRSENIDTSTASGELIFHIFAAVAEFQRQIILEAAAEGREAARRQGKPIGRPKADRRKLDYDLHLFSTGKTRSVAKICAETGIGRSTLYREADKRVVKRV